MDLTHLEPIEIFDPVNKKDIKVFVANDVAERCRTDKIFAQELFNQLRDQDIEEGSILEIATVKTEIPCPDLTLEAKSENKEPWSKRETLRFIKAYQKFKSGFENPTQKKYVWNLISKELLHHKIYKTPDKCKEKWRNLLRTYKLVHGKGSVSRFYYLKEMDNVMNDIKVVLSSESGSEDNSDINFHFNISASPNDQQSDKESWSRYETLKLLKTYQTLQRTRSDYGNEGKFWVAVSLELAKDGIEKHHKKCSIKWKNLVRTYNRVNSTKNKIPQRFNYFKEMDDVLHGRELTLSDYGEQNISETMAIPEYNSPKENTNDWESSDSEHRIFENTFDTTVKSEQLDSDLLNEPLVCWLEDETLSLIRTYKKHKHLFKYRSQKSVWNLIVSDLQVQGVDKNEEKCQAKWKSLVQAFKSSKQNNVNGFSFYDEMKDVLSNDHIDEQDTREKERYTDEKTDGNMFVNGLENNEGGEEIIIQADNSPIKVTPKHHHYSWLDNETMELLNAYSRRKSKINSKILPPFFWEDVSSDLAINNVSRTPENCEKKWNSLYSIYNTQKLLNMEGDKFKFFKAIDEIVKDNHLHNENNVKVKDKTCKCMDKKLADKQKRHEERMKMLTRKLDIEERKVSAFENYVIYLKNSLVKGTNL